MRPAGTLAVAALFAQTIVADYMPMHKRYSYNPTINDFSYLGILAKRDECSDAFGDSARNSNCAPDFTLCCTRDRLSFPSCEKYLSRGWCCVGDGDDDQCYLDSASDCDADGAVQCTKLAKGVDQACCPKLTTCDESMEATTDLVRCGINRNDLLAADKAEKDADSTTASSTASTTEAATSTTAASESTTKASETAEATESTEPESPSTPMSGGLIGGIAVATAAGVGGIAGLAFFLYRRSKKAQYEAANQSPQPTIAQYYEDQGYKQQYQGGYSNEAGSYVFAPHGQHMPPSELDAPSQPSELEVTQPPVELDGGYR